MVSRCPLGAGLDGLWRFIHLGEVVHAVRVEVAAAAPLRAVLEFLLLCDGLRRDDFGQPLEARCLEPWLARLLVSCCGEWTAGEGMCVTVTHMRGCRSRAP